MPRLMELLTPEGVKALTATCTQLRRDFCHCVTTIQMMNDQDSAMLCADKWPSLVMVVISTAVALAEKLCGDRLESCLADKGWSTIARLQLEHSPEGPTGQRSGGQQSIALIINASHQTSPDMDTKAHGSALACFAKKWEAKTQPMCMCLDSKSVHMDPLKHLQISRWPCLEWFTCHGNNDNALPISCFSGESSSNTQFATMSSCSLDAEAVQSLISACPHLYCLTLINCKIEAAAFTCLSQACSLSLNQIDLSHNQLGWLAVQSLSRCHLPALRWLSLNDSDLSALAVMHLAQGCWPKLEQLRLFGNQLSAEAVAYLVKGEWPLLQELVLSWTCVSEDAFEVLGVVDACKQLESTQSVPQPNYRHAFKQRLLLRSSLLVWPKLKALTVTV